MSGNVKMKPGMKSLAYVILLAIAVIVVLVFASLIARCDEENIEGFVIQPTREQEEIVTRIAMLVIGFEDGLKEPILKVAIVWKGNVPDEITWTDLEINEDGNINVFYHFPTSPPTEPQAEKKVGI